MGARQRMPTRKEPRKMSFADLKQMQDLGDNGTEVTPKEVPVFQKKKSSGSIDQDPWIKPFGLCLNPKCKEGIGKTRKDVGTKPYGVFDGWRAVCCRECNTIVTALPIRKRFMIDQKEEV